MLSLRDLYISRTIKIAIKLFARMVYTAYKEQHILHIYSKGYKAPTIQKSLAAGNLVCSHDCITKFIRAFERTGSICRLPGLGRPSKVTCEVKDLVEQKMVREA